MMTSKERMLAAINRQKPDRLPVTIHQWQPYHLKKYMGGMTDIEANRACGLDASINFYEVEERMPATWQISASEKNKDGYVETQYTIKTPEGVLTTSEGKNEATTWVTEHLIKKDEDIYLLKKYRPIPRLLKHKAKQTYNQLGDDGILRSFVWGKQGGCWQDACELFGVENLIYATFDKPDWVHEFLQILLDQKLDYINESLDGTTFDLIETGGGAASNTVISPAMHEEYAMPYDKKMHDALHSLGFKVVYHTCGGMTKITKQILANGCDVSETLSPDTVGGDIKTDEDALQIYADLHPHVGLIGGMDQFNILEKGSKEQIQRETERLFRLYGQQGGFILSACDHFFDAPPENLKTFAAAAKQFTY